MRRPRWTLVHAMICSAVVIACSDDPNEAPAPKEGPSQKIDRAGPRLDADRRVDANVTDRDAPREPGAGMRDNPRVDAAGDRVEGAADRAGEKIEAAGDKAAAKIEKAGDKIEGAVERHDND